MEIFSFILHALPGESLHNFDFFLMGFISAFLVLAFVDSKEESDAKNEAISSSA